MQQTTNYNLNKPEAADQYNIEHFNDNADTIDTQMKANADAISSLDNSTLKKSNNLSDLNDKSVAMTNVIDSYTAATDANVNSDNIEFMTRKTVNDTETWYKTKFSSLWNYINNKIPIDYNKFTYIVDSNTKLLAWANNTSGNDYTSVLVKRNPNSATGWSVSKGINLTATGTKVVVGEAGSALSINGNNTTIDGAFGYQSIIDSPDYYMLGVTIIAQGSSSGHAMKNCSNLINCIAYGKTNKIGFSNCEHLINCGADGIHAYNACKDVMSCRIITRGTVTRDHAFINCLSVRYCKVPSGTYNNAYSSSYSSPTADSTYLCANTLNGGYNTVGTETTIIGAPTAILKTLATNSTACADTDYIAITPSANTTWVRRTLSTLWTWIKSKIDTISNSVPIGTILPYGGRTAPTGYLFCRGQSLSRTGEYAALYSVLGIYYGSADLDHFNLPDLRECVPVGVGKNLTYDIANHDEYTIVGTFKDDQLQSHTHSYTNTYPNSYIDISTVSGNTRMTRWSSADLNSYTSVPPSPCREGDVTRGKRLGVNYIIRYK